MPVQQVKQKSARDFMDEAKAAKAKAKQKPKSDQDLLAAAIKKDSDKKNPKSKATKDLEKFSAQVKADEKAKAKAADSGKKSKAKPKKPELSGIAKMRADLLKKDQTLKDLGNKAKVQSYNIEGTPLDLSGVNELKNMALTPSQDSAWLKMATEQQGLEQAALADQASRNAATAGATAQANLAMSGGLRGGAAERLAGQAGEQGLLARQGVAQQGAMQRAGLGMNAEQNRLQALGQLPGAQMGVAQYGTGIQQFNAGQDTNANRANVGNLINDAYRRSDLNRQFYGEDTAAWGAEQQAAAVAAGKKPGANILRTISDPLGVMQNNQMYNTMVDPFNFGGKGKGTNGIGGLGGSDGGGIAEPNKYFSPQNWGK